ncbi:hypothetical protein ABT272_31010 [Streptomyces sp900105245]|uniref:Uncharacterized protein n=1 Tax=Streptomyces sp. 900105245 TaxID=3154379 RepID=A0ABV1UEI2_9ACTN
MRLRARAWLDVLRELGAGGRDDPLFRALTKRGKLRKYPKDRKRGQRMRPGCLNERLLVLAERAGVPTSTARRSPLTPGGPGRTLT